MVHIAVENYKSINKYGGSIETFWLRRELHCARSSYFSGLFHGSFQEAQAGRATLPDVSPRVFRVLIGWLCYHDVYHDHDRVERTKFARGQGLETSNRTWEGSQSIEHAAFAAKSKENTELVDLGDSTEPALPLRYHFKNTMSSSQNAGRTNIASNMVMSYQGGTSSQSSQTNAHQGIAVDLTTTDPKSESPKCKGYVVCDAVTWPYILLFELYIFAEKYSIRNFRIKIFENIQVKTAQTQPRRYYLPSFPVVGYAVERLHPTTPLYRYLVDCVAVWIGLPHDDKDNQKQSEQLEVLAVPFRAQCLVTAKWCQSALKCTKCGPDGTEEECNSVYHSEEDALHPCDLDPCSYHEHGDNDEEQARCCLRWESMAYKFI